MSLNHRPNGGRMSIHILRKLHRMSSHILSCSLTKVIFDRVLDIRLDLLMLMTFRVTPAVKTWQLKYSQTDKNDEKWPFYIISKETLIG